MSERGDILANSIDTVLRRARDLGHRGRWFHAHRVYRDAMASVVTILFLRRIDMLDDLDFSDVWKLHSLAGVLAEESRAAYERLAEEPGFGLSGNRRERGLEDHDDLYHIYSMIAGEPLENVE